MAWRALALAGGVDPVATVEAFCRSSASFAFLVVELRALSKFDLTHALPLLTRLRRQSAYPPCGSDRSWEPRPEIRAASLDLMRRIIARHVG